MKQFHFPWFNKLFNRGANTDAEAQAVGANDGTYRDARNMRTTDQAGNNGSLTKIGGERVVHPADRPGADTYHCIGSIQVKGHKVEFWASDQPNLYTPLMRIDGVTMVQSDQLPYVHGKKLQLHKAEDCGGGMVFDARSGSIPLQWDIGDIIRAFNAGEQTYFGGLDISAYQANPTRPVNRPVFRGLAIVGAGAGLKGGQIWYTSRLVNSNGDRTPEGPPLGPVMIPSFSGTGWDNSGRPWPVADVAGMAPTELGAPTGFGAELSIRANNKANFESLEILRYSYNQDGGVDAVPVIEVALRIPLVPGENTVYDLVDRGDVLDQIPSDEEALQVFFVKEANSVRYINYRLVYGGVVLGGRDMQGIFRSPAGSRVTPFTKNLGQLGHGDPVNHCYHRRFQSGERHGIGVLYYGPTGGESYVQPVENDVQLPSRRTPKTGHAFDLSDAPCYAADVNNEVGPTFEVFDHDSAVGKGQQNQVINVMEGARRREGGWVSSPHQAITPPGAGSEDGVFIDTSVPYGPWVRTSWAKPFRPVNPEDWKFGLDYRVNTAVHPDGAPNSQQTNPYNPKVYGVNHHTLGLAFSGIDTPPDGAQGFSMVATKPAGRVVAQGLAKWSIVQHDNARASKARFTVHLCLPDFNAGLMNQEIWERLQQPGSGLKLQAQSPVGMSTEQYGSALMGLGSDPNTGAVSCLADLLSVARVLWDTGQINPGNNIGGITPATPLPTTPTSGGAPDHFTAFGSWRNPLNWALPNGDGLFGITSAQEVVHATGVRSLLVNLDAPMYAMDSAPSSPNFHDPTVRAFHEPWYVVNIIQEGPEPNAQEGYIPLNNYQAFRSAIGTTTGVAGEQFRLADERMDDLLGRNTGDERFLHVLTPSGILVYLNAEHFAAQVGTIISSVNNTGSWTTPQGAVIHGLFRIVTDPNNGNLSVAVGTDGTPVAAVGSTVEVRYNKLVDVKFYGDRTTAPAIATLVDASANATPPEGIPATYTASQSGSNNSIPAWPLFNDAWFHYGGALKTFGLAVPFADYEYNGRYMVPFGRGFGVYAVPFGPSPHFNRMVVNQFSHGPILSIRQWKVIFDCEVLAPLHLSRFELNGSKTYPNLNYVQRPYNYTSASLLDNGVFPSYGDNNMYGPAEQGLWGFGGLKSSQKPMADYMLQRPVLHFRKAEFGGKEEPNQCAALIYSPKASPLQQDLPGLKTFPVSNIEYIENDTGGIQRLFSTASNLYVVTEGGVYEVLIGRSEAFSSDGTSLGLFAQDRFIGSVTNRTKNAGMPGIWWQTAAEGAPFIGEGTRVDALMWYDGDTAYMLAGSQVNDIAIGRYRKGLNDQHGAQRRQNISGAYDGTLNELYIGFDSGVSVMAGSPNTMHWQGGFDYRFDNYLYADGKMYGMRNLTTYELNSGDTINDADVLAWVKVPTAPFPLERAQWMRIRVDSPRKPKRIEWFDENDVLVAWMDEPTFGPFYLKKESVWEQYVPKKNITVDPKQNPIQGRVAYYKVIYQQPGEDKVVMTGVQAKTIK